MEIAEWKLTFKDWAVYCRQMRGEELQELTIEELHQLEKTLEAGLSRVLEKKVLFTFPLCILHFIMHIVMISFLCVSE